MPIRTAAAVLEGWCDNGFKYSAATEMKAAPVKCYWLKKMLWYRSKKKKKSLGSLFSSVSYLKDKSTVNTEINLPPFFLQNNSR